MKREIKFRAWCDPGEPSHAIMLYDRGDLSEFFDATEHDHIMQYTGLKDKNGKGIYEGDVIIQKHWNGGDNYTEPSETHEFYGVVMWHCGGFGIQTQICRGAGVEVNVCENDEYTEVEIIGNIYEDEHLLNKRKK